MSVREFLNESLRPLLPSSWVVYDFDKTISNIAKVTVLYVHKSVEPGPQVNSLSHVVSILVLDPTQAEKTADDHLDDHMEDLIPAMRNVPNIQFLRAEKGTRDGFPCWDIQLQIQTTS
ncbi:hypothetical protein [Microbacterium sp. Ag1]|uniref:hypothetical protein n=1 Tax=Microbacterium sp. Ag1 TaxID=1643443 RepID=UPI00062963C6|nr:hypothetical protein [Microbacterium sp. Ag1]KKX96925.1 hypothetical protein AAY78_16680 [Microbacterium sp. Ag1]